MNHSPVDPPVDPSDRHLDREEISAMVREALRQQIGGQYSVGARGEDLAPPIIDESTKDVITEADLRDIHADVRAGACSSFVKTRLSLPPREI